MVMLPYMLQHPGLTVPVVQECIPGLRHFPSGQAGPRPGFWGGWPCLKVMINLGEKCRGGPIYCYCYWVIGLLGVFRDIVIVIVIGF